MSSTASNESFARDPEDFARQVGASTAEVFASMVDSLVVAGAPVENSITRFSSCVSAMVGFAGNYSGIIAFHCPRHLALLFTERMLGTPVDRVNDEVSDAIGEIANMIAGNIKQLLTPGGSDVHLSIPSIIHGDSYVIASIVSDSSLMLPFSVDGDTFYVGIGIKKG